MQIKSLCIKKFIALFRSICNLMQGRFGLRSSSASSNRMEILEFTERCEVGMLLIRVMCL